MDTTATRKHTRPSESSHDGGCSRKVPAIAPKVPHLPLMAHRPQTLHLRPVLTKPAFSWAGPVQSAKATGAKGNRSCSCSPAQYRHRHGGPCGPPIDCRDRYTRRGDCSSSTTDGALSPDGPRSCVPAHHSPLSLSLSLTPCRLWREYRMCG